AAAKEFANRDHDQPDVHQTGRRGGRRIDDAHPLLDHSLNAKQSDSKLILNQLAHRPDPAIAEMVDVVGLALAVVDPDHLADNLDQVGRCQDPLHGWNVETQPLVDLVAADAPEVIAAETEEERIQ